jgi:prepilin-type N-terminal cleavage/methylation domain-containing protein
MPHSHEKGFTLVELLVAMAIIGLLAGLVFATVGPSRESAKITKAVEDVVQIRNAIELYRADTGFTPPSCGSGQSCSPSLNPLCGTTSYRGFGGRCRLGSDPLLTATGGSSGWNGPYYRIHDKTHPWKGGMALLSWEGEADLSGPMLQGILFDDDTPFRPNGQPVLFRRDSRGQIPPSALQRMDEALDDGDLTTGRFRGNPINQPRGQGPVAINAIDPLAVFWGTFPIEPGEGLLMLGEANCNPDWIVPTSEVSCLVLSPF